MLKNNFTKKIIIFGLLTEIIYLIFYFIEPLKKYLGDTALTSSHYYVFLLVVGLLLFALAIYIFTYRQVNKNNLTLKLFINRSPDLSGRRLTIGKN